MSKPDTDDGTVRWRFRLDKSQIGYVRFILESYEGLAQMTSTRGRAEVEWIVQRCLLADARRLASALEAEVGLVHVPGTAPF